MIFDRLLNIKPVNILLICLCMVFAVTSCDQNNKRRDDFYKQVFDKAEDMYNKGNGREGVNYIDSVFKVNGDASPYYQYRRFHFIKLFYYYAHLYDSNRIYVDSMLDVLESAKISKKYPTEYADALNDKGDIYYMNNELGKAFEYYYRSRVAAMEAKNFCALANQSYHLGMISYRQEKYDAAINYFKQTYDETTSCGADSIFFYKKEELFNNIALSFTQLKKYDSAGMYYRKALNYLDIESPKYGSTVKQFAEVATGVIYGNLAKIYIALNKPDTARALLLQSIAINSKPGYDNNDALLAKIQLAELYFKTRDMPATIGLLQQIDVTLDSLPNLNVKLRQRHLLYEYYNETGDRGKALQFLQEYVQTKGIADSKEEKVKQLDVNQILKSQEARYQVQLLRKNNQLNQLYLAVAAGVSVLTTIIIVLIFINYRRSRKSVQQLTILNHQVNEQKDHLEYAAGELTKMNRSKNRILHVVAHDLRNPVSGMLALSDIVLVSNKPDPHKESWQMIKSTAQLSLKLINRLSEMGNETMDEIPGEKEVVELNELIRQVAALLQYKANDKKQKISLALPPDPLNVFAYKEKIWRVLSNVIVNAIKFSEPGAVISVSSWKKNDSAVIEVKDNGIGIPDDLQPFVFDMFTSAKRDGTEGESSFGLGLSICKQIVEENKGTIRFESKNGKGTSFFVELPLVK